MARRHGDFLSAGVRLYGISVDAPAQNAAMVEKLDLPFPLLSDPDRSALIEPFGVADPKDRRELATPAMILLAEEGREVWRFVSRDFADRLPEQEALDVAEGQGWPPTDQASPEAGDPVPGPKAMSVEALVTYFRGARFAALAMGLRHRHLAEEIADDSKAYVAEMDRYTEAVSELLHRRP